MQAGQGPGKGRENLARKVFIAFCSGSSAAAALGGWTEGHHALLQQQASVRWMLHLEGWPFKMQKVALCYYF